MSKRLWLSVFITVMLPLSAWGIIDRFSSPVGYDHVADAGKVLAISPTGAMALHFGTNNILNVRDFGAIPDDGLDDSVAINAAIGSVGSSGNPKGVQIFIPHGTYRLSTPIRMVRQSVLYGEGGSGWFSSTILQPDKNVSGIVIESFASSPSGGRGDWSVIKDVSVQYASQTTHDWQPSHGYVVGDTVRSAIVGSGTSAVAGANWNPLVVFVCSTAGTSSSSEPAWGSKSEGQTITDGGVTWTATVVAGIRFRARARVENVWITGSPGQAILVQGDVTGTPSTNANGWHVEYARIDGPALDGIFIVGGDSNAGQAQYVDIDAAGYWGIDDNSFLGNTHIGHEVADCGLGPYRSAGLNADNIFMGCYSEGGQPPAFYAQRTLVLGGLQAGGAGFTDDSVGMLINLHQNAIDSLQGVTFERPNNAGQGIQFVAVPSDGYAFQFQDATMGYSLGHGPGVIFGGHEWALRGQNADGETAFLLSSIDAGGVNNGQGGHIAFPNGTWLTAGGPSYTHIHTAVSRPTSESINFQQGAYRFAGADTLEQEGHIGGVLGWQKVHQGTYSGGTGPDYFTVRTPHFGTDNTIAKTTTVGSPYAINFLDDSGRTFVNDGATAKVGILLPPISRSVFSRRSTEFGFAVTDSDGIRVVSYDGSRKIQWGNHALADYIESTAVGSFLKVKAEFNIPDGPSPIYTIVEASGVWTDNNGLVINPLSGPASATTGHVPQFADGSGGILSDSGTPVANLVTVSRNVTAGTGLLGGGALTSDITLSANFGSTGNTICQGNDARLAGIETVAAAGSDQSGATALTGKSMVVVSSGSGGVRLKAPDYSGQSVTVFAPNLTITVYPQSGGAMLNAIGSSIGNNVGVTTGLSSMSTFVATSSTQWMVYQQMASLDTTDSTHAAFFNNLRDYGVLETHGSLEVYSNIGMHSGSDIYFLTGNHFVQFPNSTVWHVEDGSARHYIETDSTVLPLKVNINQNLYAQSNVFFTQSTAGITAHAGGGQSSATVLSSTVNSVDTVAAVGDSVRLPTGATVPTGQLLIVGNTTATAMSLYPAPSGNINELGTDVGLSIGGGVVAECTATTTSKWLCQKSQSAHYATYTATGTTQGTCTPITTAVSNVTAGDGLAVCLPGSTGLTVGDTYRVTCSTSANPGGTVGAFPNTFQHFCAVFPAASDTITPYSANASDIIPASMSVNYRYKGSNTWAAEPSPGETSDEGLSLGHVGIYGELILGGGWGSAHGVVTLNGNSGNQIIFSASAGENRIDLPANYAAAVDFRVPSTGNNLLRLVSTTNANEVQIIGAQSNTNAPTGYVGEYVSSCVTAASGLTLNSGVSSNITSVSLTAGDWDVNALGGLTGTLTGTDFQVGISATSGTLGAKGDATAETPTVSSAAADVSLAVPGYRVSVPTTTVEYLVEQATVSVGTPKGYGCIKARRAR